MEKKLVHIWKPMRLWAKHNAVLCGLIVDDAWCGDVGGLKSYQAGGWGIKDGWRACEKCVRMIPLIDLLEDL